MTAVDHNRVRRYYDDEYYARQREGETANWHLRKVAARLGDLRGKSVLDVACGSGEWLAELIERGALGVGIDISAAALERCRVRVPLAELHEGLAEELPFDDCRFDLVTCLGSLEHFLDERKALAEMRRVARGDARFLILVPNARFLTRRLGLYRGTQQTVVKEDVKSLREWESLFRSVGLRVDDRWRDLHMLNRHWIRQKGLGNAVLRSLQALALPLWPIDWQYQVYFVCAASH